MGYKTAHTILLICLFSSVCLAGNKEITIRQTEIKGKLEKVADWQLSNFAYSATGDPGYLHDYGIDAWTNGVLYIGLSDLAKIADDNTKYLNWLHNLGNEHDWKIPKNFINFPKYSKYHADELCVGQFYLKMYDQFQNDAMIKYAKERLDWIINNPPDTTMEYKSKQAWTWCDALFMAPPLYTHMYMITKEDKYIEFMDINFKKTYKHLYDKDEQLFYRDGSYFDKREENGQKVFWGRGNGWVAAGIVNILKLLPKDSCYRPFYEELFKEHIARLAQLITMDGSWHASLLDPENYPAPETSATALITYAIAYGINNGLLNPIRYIPIVEKSWETLIKSIDDDGKLGWVQPIGADPRKVTKDMTAVYGVGAFLMAGCEMFKLTTQ